MRLMNDRMPREGKDDLLHVRARREVISGSAGCGRATPIWAVRSHRPRRVLQNGGYGAVVRDLKQVA
jgi:hypothetical protein